MKKDYEYLDSKRVLKELKTSLNGLTEREAKHRLKEYGLNELPKEKQKTIFEVFPYGVLKIALLPTEEQNYQYQLFPEKALLLF